MIDEASSRVRLRASSLPPEGKEVEKELRKIRRDKEMAIRNQEFEKAAHLREQETKLSDKIKDIQTAWKAKQETEKPVVNFRRSCLRCELLDRYSAPQVDRRRI